MTRKLLSHVLLRGTLLTFIGLLTLVAPVLAAAPAKPDQPDYEQIYSQDVFVIVGSTLRHPTSDTAPEAPLFNSAGVNLGVMWGKWQAATATSVAKVKGGKRNPQTVFKLHLTGLIPNGVYSIFYGTLTPDSENSLCPGVERTLPLLVVQQKKKNPDASSVVANARGEAKFKGTANGDLFTAGQVFLSIVYHSDGAVYGSLPNHGEYLTQGSNCRSSFGEDAMRQLYIFQKGQ